MSGVESWVLRATGIRPRTTCWPASTINTPTTHISHTGLLESGRICGGWSACRTMSKHRENSPVTQTTTQPTLLTWGGGPWKKNSLQPWPCSQTQSYCTYQATQTPLFSNLLMLPFDTHVCHLRQIYLRFHWILKVILEMAFSAHCTNIWKLDLISMTIISKVARKFFWCYHQVQWFVTAFHSGGKLCSETLKRGQGSHYWCEPV